MKIEKRPKTDDEDEKKKYAKVCRNCFWSSYCSDNLEFDIFDDSTCVFKPSAFQSATMPDGSVIKAFGKEKPKAASEEHHFDEDAEGHHESILFLAEKYLIIDALTRKSWVQKDAAEYLGVSQRTMHYLCRKHELRHPNWWKYRTLENDEEENNVEKKKDETETKND